LGPFYTLVMTLENHVSKLNELKTNLPKEVDKILIKNEKVILTMLKFRLFTFGTDGNYDKLEGYSKKTIAIKKKNNQKTNITTLRDQGNFYAGMYLEVESGKILISSKDRKTGLIAEKYGPSIFELTYKQQADIISNIIEPELQKLIDFSIKDFNISL